MIELVRKLWERITGRGPSHSHIDNNDHFIENQKIFAIERGKQNLISRRLDIVQDTIIYNCVYFSGACVHTYYPKDNKTNTRFTIGDWDLPKYYKNNLGNNIIKVLPFKYEDYNFNVTASQDYISIEFYKLNDGIHFINSYDHLNILRDHSEIKRKIKKFVKDNKHLNYECKDNIIQLDISHI
tara:strand:- start:28376 stop:28924 length:549 start_codon:yes stop_codon:yes gene_type:complete